MVHYNFKKIQVIPGGKEFVDIVLTRTQRRLPTQIHKGYPITTIRKFYMRKVKFTQQTIEEKFQQILTDFPILDEIHPFYADLLNILYDKDHYKLALGQINNAKRLVDNIARDSIRLLKYGDSLYRCKMLKRAALGRMVKIVRRQAPSLAYLEEVRQHMSRLPSIDPNTRTLLVCGYPNVGKSSFVNKVTRANVEVQPYAFTTKSLLVGHMYHKYFHWQVIDSPGILDHPIEDRNTIEMQSITALAHLRSAILYFIDISEQCGYTIQQQVSLFESIAPLFRNKPLVVVLNKVDARPFSALDDEDKQLIQNVLDSVPGSKAIEMSSVEEIGISQVKETACEMLLELRNEMKLRSTKRDEILTKTYVAVPKPRDNRERKPFVLSSPEERKVARRKLEEFEEQQRLYYEMDPEYTGVDFKKYYMLENPEWNHDKIPEIMDGVNIFDYWDPDLMKRLEELEAEEEQLLRDLADQEDEEDYLAQLTPEQRETLEKIRETRKQMILESRLKTARNHAVVPHKVKGLGTVRDFKDYLDKLGYDSTKAYERAKSRSKSRGRKRTFDDMDVETSLSRRPVSKAPLEGFGDIDKKKIAERLEKKAYRVRNRQGKSGPGDNAIINVMPKHLFSGKRSFKADRR